MRPGHQLKERTVATGRHQNELLARLDSAAFAAIEGSLSVAHLTIGHEIAKTHGRVNKVYFPHNAIISCVVELVGGGAIETGMIGKDGQFGALAALDDQKSPNSVSIQVEGDVSVMDADTLRSAAREYPRLRDLMIRYEQFFLAQAQQTAACNAVHRVEERICKWLLRMQRLVGDDFSLTQEFLAQMMGVRRTSVTEVASKLQALGMITYWRGRIHINDVAQIQERACECAVAISDHHAELFAD